MEADGLESNCEHGNSVLGTNHTQIPEPVIHPSDLSLSPFYRSGHCGPRSVRRSVHPTAANTEDVVTEDLLCTRHRPRDMVMRLSETEAALRSGIGQAQTRVEVSCHQVLDPSLSPAISPPRKDFSENQSMSPLRVSLTFLLTPQPAFQTPLCFPRPHGGGGQELQS